MNTKTRRLLAPLAATALLLSACAGPQDAAPAPQVTVTVPAAEAVAEAEASATPAPAPKPEQESCAQLTGQQAAEQSKHRLPTGGYPWAVENADVSTYDPCAALSWIVVPIEGPTGSSPYQIMLFNRGEFVHTATETSYGFFPDVKRVAEHQISVTYHWTRDGESNAESSGRSTSEFMWDDASASVKRRGDLPPGYPDSGQQSKAAAPVPGAYPGAGGPRPANATPIRTYETPQYGDEVAYFKTPSGNIGCDFSVGYAACGVESYIQSGKYDSGDNGVGPPWWIDFSGSSLPQVMPKGDPPTYMSAAMPAQVIQYGQVLYEGNYVCASEEAGLTCWNTVTGRGVFMNKAGFKPF